MTTNQRIDAKFAGHRMSVKKVFEDSEIAAILVDEFSGAEVAVGGDGTVMIGVCRLRRPEIASMIAAATTSKETNE